MFLELQQKRILYKGSRRGNNIVPIWCPTLTVGLLTKILTVATWAKASKVEQAFGGALGWH